MIGEGCPLYDEEKFTTYHLPLPHVKVSCLLYFENVKLILFGHCLFLRLRISYYDV